MAPMVSLLLAFTLGAGLHPGFPRDAGGRITQPALGLQLDGAPVVVVSAGDWVAAFRADGGAVAGFPFLVPGGEQLAGAPAAADLHGDGRPEVAVVTTAGKVYVLGRGGVAAGFPVSLGAKARAGASFADVDGDGQLELLVGDEKGRVHAFKRSGARARGFPIQGGQAAVTSSVSSSPFAGGPSLAWGCQDGKVQVFSTAGAARAGFPLVTGFAVSAAPVFADLDDDGQADLVVASQDFKVYVVDGKGQALPGFPVAAGYRIYDAPAIADLDGDHRLDVIFTSADGFLHAVDHVGRALAGFPVRVGPRLFSGPAVGDVDRDGALEVVVTLSDGTVNAVTRAGRILRGFPASLGESEVSASPLLADLTGEGAPAILVGTPSGRLHGLVATRNGAVAGAIPWSGSAHDAARTGRFGPNPPSYKALALTPAAPRLGDSLQAAWRATWLDAAPGASIPAPRLEWLRDGKPVAGLEGRAKLPPGTARRGERWRFSLAGAGNTLVESPEVRILDTAPSPPVVRLEPPSPARGAPVKAVVGSPAVDPDGDPVTYRFEWLLDGKATGVTGDTFPGDQLRRGLLLTARVVASDGELDSAPALAEGRVLDSAPGPAVIALASPRRLDKFSAQLQKPATDVDGDPLVYHYRWSIDGKPQPLPLAGAKLPTGLLRKHQRVRVEVRAFDGEQEGPPVVADVEVRNTPPGPPQVEIRPARPRRGEALRAVVNSAAVDADGDPLSYSFVWTRNGKPLDLSGDPREVPGASVTRGDQFQVSVQAFDGEEKGPPGTASATVVNTPPEPPRIAIEPRHPRGGEPLKLVVSEPARDADGDPVSLQVVWTHDGKPAGSGTDTLAPGAFHKGDRVRVVVTPSDGKEPGLPASDEVTVDNAPPTTPTVALEPAPPTVGGPLRAVIKVPAQDPDGDWITYRFRWLRDGSPVQLSGEGRGTDWGQSAGWTKVNELPADLLTRGQRWEVEVQAFDGVAYGPSVRAAAVVGNSPPPPPEIAFRPIPQRTVDGLSLEVKQRPDPDGDRVTHRFTWTRNGARYQAPPDQSHIPRGVARKGETWGVEVVAFDGQAESAPARAQLVVADTAPGAAEVSLCDEPVVTGTVPEVKITRPAVDPDGDAVSYRYEWSLNGRPVPQAQQARFTSPLKKRDVARVKVTPWDGELAGTPVEASCAGRNTPPGRPVAVLDPATPTTLSGLTVKLVEPATDADGDPVTYRYRWSRDGSLVPAEGPTMPPRSFHRGEVWRVEVVAFDGEEEGKPLLLTTTVGTAVPPRPLVTVKPAAPVAGASLTCEVTGPVKDAYPKPITIGNRWSRNDKVEPLAEGQLVLPAGVVRRGDRWRCEAWAADGPSESPRASAEVTVQNSPPGAPQVVIEPEVAHVRDEISCRVAAPAIDPDGDQVTYTFAWWRNDRPLADPTGGGKMSQVAISKGDRYKCSVTPSDGTAKGPPGSAERVIANAAPGPARVRIEPSPAITGRPIRCKVTSPSEDPDKDSVRYRYRWQRNGAPQPFAESSEEVPIRMIKSGDRWRCQVVPTDGDLDGPESGSDEVLVQEPP